MNHEAYLIGKDRLLPWLEDLGGDYRIIGPVLEEGFPAFRAIDSVGELSLDYGLTMMGPQTHIHRLTERMCTIRQGDGTCVVELPEKPSPQVLLGVRSCDLHAILVLDKVFLRRPVQDRNYRMWRESTVLMGFHCTSVHPQCFCASMGTGPLFEPREAYDFLFTDLGNVYLVETLGERPREMIAVLEPEAAGEEHFRAKEALGRSLLDMFVKKLDTTDIVRIILENQDHPVWKKTADARCLGCANCTMVCPTCFCYDPRDYMNFDLDCCERVRHKDSCQELHFAEVHGGNFRETRKARLRQFVTHKLATWWEQFGCFGCVGCGRCMTWCPTKIDLTEMAREIMATERDNAARLFSGTPEREAGLEHFDFDKPREGENGKHRLPHRNSCGEND